MPFLPARLLTPFNLFRPCRGRGIAPRTTGEPHQAHVGHDAPPSTGTAALNARPGSNRPGHPGRSSLRVALTAGALLASLLPSAEASDRSFDATWARGLEMHERDQAAWRATDLAFGVGLAESGTQGWISVRTGEGWLVRFVAPCGAMHCSVLDVRLTGDDGKARRLDTPEPLDAREERMWRARQTAASQPIEPCSERYNSVVIPEGAGPDRWIVYLLPATTDPSVIVATGFHRFTVSGDGTTLLGHDPLFRACVRIPKDPRPEAIVVSHVLDPHPIETHVFLSLSHELPVYVVLKDSVFEVSHPGVRSGWEVERPKPTGGVESEDGGDR